MSGNSQSQSTSSTRTAVLYARVSSARQEKEGFSVPAQIKLGDAYADKNDIDIVKVFSEAESAKRAGRDAFGDMVKFLRKNRSVRIVLFEQIDRIYRNFEDMVELDKLDVEIHETRPGGEVWTPQSSAGQLFFKHMKVAMASHTSRGIGEQASKGMLAKAEAGIYPSRAHAGYQNVKGTGGKRTISVDPETGPLVARLFDEYGTGNHSLNTLREAAFTWGLTDGRGRRLSKSSLQKILKDPFYIGKFKWRGKTYDGRHEHLTTAATFQRVQDVLERNFTKKKQRVKRKFTFQKLIACGHCGCAVVGYQVQRKTRAYRYYHCSGYKGKCPEPYVREEDLEQRFADILKQLVMPERVLGWLKVELRKDHVEHCTHQEQAVRRLRVEYDRIKKRLDAMYDDRLDGRITPEFYAEKAAGYEAEQIRVMAAIEEYRAENVTYLEEGVRILELAQSAHFAYLRQKPEDKRQLLDFVLLNSTWANGELSVTFRQPFDMLAVSVKEGGEAEDSGTPFDAEGSPRQAPRDSNPQPSVLETDALPVELEACRRYAYDRSTVPNTL